MGYEDSDIITIETNLRNINTSISRMVVGCRDWKRIDAAVTMTTDQASGLSTDIEGWMGDITTSYLALSGTFNGL